MIIMGFTLHIVPKYHWLPKFLFYLVSDMLYLSAYCAHDDDALQKTDRTPELA